MTPRGQALGQVLMLTVFLMLLLFLTIPHLVEWVRVGTRQQVASSKKAKALAIAEEGIAYARNRLAALSEPQWANALAANDFGPIAECTNNAVITGASGGRFQINCNATDPARRPYQAVVIATGLLPGATAQLQAFISRKTLGVTLPTGLQATAALELVRRPDAAADGRLTVHWGPIVCRDATSNPPPLWTLWDPLDRVNVDGTDYQGHPRKFYTGPITGNNVYPRTPTLAGTAATSDQREYWAFASLGFPPQIDEDAVDGYVFRARNITAGVTPPVPPGAPDASCAVANCGYFDVGAGEAVFDAGVPGYTAPAGSVIYVRGNARFERMRLDGATVVVTGNLTLGAPAGTGDDDMNLQVPNTAPLEYPYWPQGGTPWPCRADAGGTCNSDVPLTPAGRVQFRGFLYVKGNLIVTAGNAWNLAGTVVVGDMSAGTGELQVQGQLTVLYDDIIAHDIRLQNLILKTDRVVQLAS